MKKRKWVLCLMALTAAAALWYAAPWEARNGPPVLTVKCGEQKAQVGFWSAQWAGLRGFNADGDAPTAPYIRDELPVFYAKPGDILNLSYPVAPARLSVQLNYDSPEWDWSETLLDGRPWGRKEFSIQLPDNFRGVYEVSEEWSVFPSGSGNAHRGFLVVGEGNALTHPSLTQPPELTVSLVGQEAVTAWRGTYNWVVLPGPGEVEAVCSDSPHPLDVLEELPVLKAQPGDLLEFRFGVHPDEITVRAYSARDMGQAEQAVAREVERTSAGDLRIPEDGRGMVYEVQGSWCLPTDTLCDVFYAFYVP